MRAQMQSEQVDIAQLKGLPIGGQFVINYPYLKMRIKLTKAELADLTPYQDKDASGSQNY